MLTDRCPTCNSVLGPNCTCVRGEFRMQEPETPNLWSPQMFNVMAQTCNAVEAAQNSSWPYTYVHNMYFNSLSKGEFEKLIVKFTIVNFDTLKITREVDMVAFKDGYILAKPNWGTLEVFHTKTDDGRRLYASREEALLDLLEAVMDKRKSLKFQLRQLKKKLRVLNKELGAT